MIIYFASARSQNLGKFTKLRKRNRWGIVLSYKDVSDEGPDGKKVKNILSNYRKEKDDCIPCR